MYFTIILICVYDCIAICLLILCFILQNKWVELNDYNEVILPLVEEGGRQHRGLIALFWWAWEVWCLLQYHQDQQEGWKIPCLSQHFGATMQASKRTEPKQTTCLNLTTGLWTVWLASSRMSGIFKRCLENRMLRPIVHIYPMLKTRTCKQTVDENKAPWMPAKCFWAHVEVWLSYNTGPWQTEVW